MALIYHPLDIKSISVFLKAEYKFRHQGTKGFSSLSIGKSIEILDSNVESFVQLNTTFRHI